MAVVVVSDSSSRLGADDEKRWNIRAVPLHVLVDGVDLRDGVDEIPYDIHDRPKVTTARAARGRTHVFLVVHRLDNLRRSGRIGTASSWLGTALSLKPLLRLDVDGRLVLDQRIRTVSKAHAALVDRVADAVGEAPADVVVHHVDNHDAADELGAALTQRLPQLSSLSVADMGPVLSVHVGAGAVGVAVQVAAR